LVLFCCPHLMPERIINCPVTKNPFVESWFARFGHARFPRALPNGFCLGIQFRSRAVGFSSDSVAGPFAEPRSLLREGGGRGRDRTRLKEQQPGSDDTTRDREALRRAPLAFIWGSCSVRGRASQMQRLSPGEIISSRCQHQTAKHHQDGQGGGGWIVRSRRISCTTSCRLRAFPVHVSHAAAILCGLGSHSRALPYFVYPSPAVSGHETALTRRCFGLDIVPMPARSYH
jgi:hypothetical protein